VEAILCPRPRDHPVGFGYRNIFSLLSMSWRGLLQVTVERVIKIRRRIVPTDSRTPDSRNCNGKPRQRH